MASIYCQKCGTECDAADQFCKTCKNNLWSSSTVAATPSPSTKSEKSGYTALLLAVFLGYIGAHRFYVGKIGTGILMLITLGGMGVWCFIDVFIIAYGEFTDKNGQCLTFTPRKELRISKIFKVIGVILLSYIVLITVLSKLILYSMGPTVVAINHLAALRAHDYSKAYAYTSTDFKKITSLEAFKKFVISNPVINNNKDFEYTYFEIDGVGIISGTLEAKDGSKIFMTYKVIKERGEWKIDKIDLQR